MRWGRLWSSFWQSSQEQGWSDDAKLLGTYLISCEECNLIGCFYLPTKYIEANLDWDTERVCRAENELSVTHRFMRRDLGWVFLENYTRHNPLASPNHEKAALGALQLVRSAHLQTLAAKALESQENSISEGTRKDLRRYSEGPSKVLRSQKQKQEQKQEQEHEHKQARGEVLGNTFPLKPTEQPPDIADVQLTDVRQVIEHYCKLWPKRRAQAERAGTRAIIRDRLNEEYSASALCEAIDANAKDTWALKNRWHNLRDILKEPERIDKYLTPEPDWDAINDQDIDRMAEELKKEMFGNERE